MHLLVYFLESHVSGGPRLRVEACDQLQAEKFNQLGGLFKLGFT